AARRCARDLCRRQRSGARNRLPARDLDRGWDRKIRRLVPKLPQGLAHEVWRTQVLRTRESCTLVAYDSWCAERGTDMSGETERASPRVAVVVPCYNEALTIASVVRRANAALPGASVYVYDNNSSDDTVNIARAAGAIVASERSQGKGNV